MPVIIVPKLREPLLVHPPANTVAAHLLAHVIRLISRYRERRGPWEEAMGGSARWANFRLDCDVPLRLGVGGGRRRAIPPSQWPIGPQGRQA